MLEKCTLCPFECKVKSILYLCKTKDYIYGLVLSIAYSFGKLMYNLYHYKKEYINIDIK